jgi:hypothetical protein
VTEDAETYLAHRPWPPAFAETFVARTRARLDEQGVLVVVGPAEGSRDTLAAAVAGLVDRPSPHRHVARPGETHLSHFVLDQLWRGDRLPVGADSGTLEARVREQLAGRPSTPRIVLVDAELGDAGSLEVLVRLAETGAVRLVATTSDASLPALARLREVGAVVAVAPLDADEVADRLAARFDAVPDPSVVEHVLERTGGSYELVRRVVDATVASGLVDVRGGVLAGTRPLDDPAAAAPDADPALMADLLDVTALVGRLDPDECDELFGGPALELAVRRGVLAATVHAVDFVFAVEATQVRRAVTLERQVDLFDRYHGKLTRSVARPGVAPRVADWWAATGRPLPVDLAGRATRESNLEARFRRALVHSAPGHHDGQGAIAHVERAYALVELGDTRGVPALFADVDPACLSEDELYAYLLAVQHLDDRDERDRLVRRAVTAPDPADQRRRDAVRTLADLVHQTFAGSGDRVATRLRALTFSGQLSPGNRAVTFTALSAALRGSARPTQAVQAAEFALESIVTGDEPVRAFHLDPTREVLIAALVSALDLDGALVAVEAYVAGPFGTGGGRLGPVMQVYVQMQRGAIQDALDHARVYLDDHGSHDPHRIRGWVEAMAAECLVHLDRPDEAVVLLDAARRHPSPTPETDLARRIAMAAAHDALAEPEDALEILDGVIAEATTRELVQVRIEAAAAGVLVGGPPQLARLLDAVEPLVDPTGRADAWQRFARGVRAYEIPAIVELAIDLEARHARLMASGIAQFVLDMARRATDLDDATRAYLATLADLSDPHRG